jgi:hypothetical protein
VSQPAICAAPECANVVVRRPGQPGRPRIYCSKECRPTPTRPALTVELDQDDDDQLSGRDWVVRVRRGAQSVVVGHGLGRFSATAMATELRVLLEGTPGGAKRAAS